MTGSGSSSARGERSSVRTPAGTPSVTGESLESDAPDPVQTPAASGHPHPSTVRPSSSASPSRARNALRARSSILNP